MATIMTTQGQLVDMTTGEVVGRAEGAPPQDRATQGGRS